MLNCNRESLVYTIIFALKKHHSIIFETNFLGTIRDSWDSLVAQSVKNLPGMQKRELPSISEWERSTGEGNGNLLQSSCLENPRDRGAGQATIHEITRVGHDVATKPPPGKT